MRRDLSRACEGCHLRFSDGLSACPNCGSPSASVEDVLAGRPAGVRRATRPWMGWIQDALVGAALGFTLLVWIVTRAGPWLVMCVSAIVGAVGIGVWSGAWEAFDQQGLTVRFGQTAPYLRHHPDAWPRRLVRNFGQIKLTDVRLLGVCVGYVAVQCAGEVALAGSRGSTSSSSDAFPEALGWALVNHVVFLAFAIFPLFRLAQAARAMVRWLVAPPAPLQDHAVVAATTEWLESLREGRRSVTGQVAPLTKAERSALRELGVALPKALRWTVSGRVVKAFRIVGILDDVHVLDDAEAAAFAVVDSGGGRHLVATNDVVVHLPVTSAPAEVELSSFVGTFARKRGFPQPHTAKIATAVLCVGDPVTVFAEVTEHREPGSNYRETTKLRSLTPSPDRPVLVEKGDALILA